VGTGTVESLVEGPYHWPHLIGRDAIVMMDHQGGLALAALDLRSGEVKSLGITGTAPRYLSTGHLAYADGEGVLWAAAFDAASLEITGSPVRLIDGIEVKASNEGAADFDISDDGHLVYAVSASDATATNLVSVGPDGGRTLITQVGGIAWYPRFSPEGDRIAFALGANYNTGTTADLWVIDLARGARTRLTFGGNRRFFPVWTPDGRNVTNSDGPAIGNTVLSVSADGSGVVDTLLAGGNGRQFGTSWSPDGRVLAYHVGPQDTPTNSRDVWISRLDRPDGRGEPFVATPFEESSPRFSPNGSWVAYVSNKFGQNEVFARPFPGPGPEVTISIGGGSEPVWSPSGGQLYYRSASDLMAVSLDPTSASLAVGAPRRLFEDSYVPDRANVGMANYDVAPDGDRLVMVEEVVSEAAPQAAANRLHIVLNWFEELRARVPN
jgi:Tol biopolymer transport system component